VIIAGDRDIPNAWNEDTSAVVVVTSPVEVPFAADDEVADLVIAADLAAADESAVVAVVEIVEEERVGPIVRPRRRLRWHRGRIRSN
jgi:hypothetical protein